jgi:hypothetical protein
MSYLLGKLKIDYILYRAGYREKMLNTLSPVPH